MLFQWNYFNVRLFPRHNLHMRTTRKGQYGHTHALVFRQRRMHLLGFAGPYMTSWLLSAPSGNSDISSVVNVNSIWNAQISWQNINSARGIGNPTQSGGFVSMEPTIPSVVLVGNHIMFAFPFLLRDSLFYRLGNVCKTWLGLIMLANVPKVLIIFARPSSLRYTPPCWICYIALCCKFNVYNFIVLTLRTCALNTLGRMRTHTLPTIDRTQPSFPFATDIGRP